MGKAVHCPIGNRAVPLPRHYVPPPVVLSLSMGRAGKSLWGCVGQVATFVPTNNQCRRPRTCRRQMVCCQYCYDTVKRCKKPCRPTLAAAPTTSQTPTNLRWVSYIWKAAVAVVSNAQSFRKGAKEGPSRSAKMNMLSNVAQEGIVLRTVYRLPPRTAVQDQIPPSNTRLIPTPSPPTTCSLVEQLN